MRDEGTAKGEELGKLEGKSTLGQERSAKAVCTTVMCSALRVRQVWSEACTHHTGHVAPGRSLHCCMPWFIQSKSWVPLYPILQVSKQGLSLKCKQQPSAVPDSEKALKKYMSDKGMIE